MGHPVLKIDLKLRPPSPAVALWLGGECGKIAIAFLSMVTAAFKLGLEHHALSA